MHIAIVTAGGAGMYCGSCMHDNTWARALRLNGAQVSLIPTYTPLRLDEHDESSGRIHYGGLSVYLNHKYGWWRRLPRFLTSWVDRPSIIKLATSFGVSNNAQELGALTVSLLQGAAGPERPLVEQLTSYLADELKPDVILFSNAMVGAIAPALRPRFAGPLICVLQGDDVFLKDLVEPYQTESFRLLHDICRHYDGYLVHSDYYREFMAEYLGGLPRDRFRTIPLGIDLDGHDGRPRPRTERPAAPFTVGYFARICPEKGLHQLVEGFRIFHRRHPQSRLVAGGYLGPRDQAYFDQVQRDAADLGTAFEYIGAPPTRTEKIAFLQTLDVLSVPTTYREPKGLYVLEAWANGVPVVQPRHGSFPEMIAATGGGLLVAPGDAEDLARGLETMCTDEETRLRCAHAGHENVRRLYGYNPMVERTLEALDEWLALRGGRGAR